MPNKLFNEISELRTELNNPASKDIDILPTIDILQVINDEDQKIAEAVKHEIPDIAKAVDGIAERFKKGGRLIYVGAGTSGRLGVVDASECPPTYGTNPQMVQGIIAGGKEAVFKSQEGAEDSPEKGAEEIIKLKINKNDSVCGIAASGRTPFVRGAINKAKEIGAFTIMLSTSTKEHIKELRINADVVICPHVGPEVIAGSTRMKSGTAQKLVLNMLTTASMVKLGKTFGNVMVDLQLTNAKLKERSKKILMEMTGIDYHNAEDYLEKSNGHVKTALVMILAEVDMKKAQGLLEKANGFVKKAIQLA